MTSRGSMCREFCSRGWSNRDIDDQQPVQGFAIVGMEAERLAKEDGGRLVLVTPRGELAEQAICEAALWIEANDIAEVGLCIEVTPQRDLGARPDQEQRQALGLLFQCVRTHRHDTGVMPGFEQLRRCCDHSSVHTLAGSKARASPRAR
jgi:hypothetical protein